MFYKRTSPVTRQLSSELSSRYTNQTTDVSICEKTSAGDTLHLGLGKLFFLNACSLKNPSFFPLQHSLPACLKTSHCFIHQNINLLLVFPDGFRVKHNCYILWLTIWNERAMFMSIRIVNHHSLCRHGKHLQTFYLGGLAALPRQPQCLNTPVTSFTCKHVTFLSFSL